jgi:hypothetical protein
MDEMLFEIIWVGQTEGQRDSGAKGANFRSLNKHVQVSQPYLLLHIAQVIRALYENPEHSFESLATRCVWLDP